MNKPQATRASQKQLDCLAYWQARGYTFGRDDVIPESIENRPRAWCMPRSIELVVTGICLVIVGTCLYVSGGVL